LTKILQVNKFYPPHIGGVEKIVRELSQGLAATAEVSVLTCEPRGRGRVERDGAVRVRRCASLATWLSMPTPPAFPFRLAAESGRADIVHFHHPFPLAELTFALAGTPARSVVTWHGDIIRQRWSARVYRPFLKRFLRKVDRIVVTSPEMLEHSALLQPFRSKCEIIPLGIDVKVFSPTPEVAAAARAVRGRYKGPLVLFAGRLVYYKGLEYLIRAMRQVEASCLIVGEGPLKKKLKSLAASLEVAHRITFLPSCTQAELVAYYHACDVFVLPSVEPAEGFGLVQLEAMACGKPVISTDLPTGVRFVNQDGVTGLRVPPRDDRKLAEALQRLLADPGLRESLGENARKRVAAEFNQELMVERYEQLFTSLVSSPRVRDREK
jgi:glycosyltransferase involved in cell wall biosynthesis